MGGFAVLATLEVKSDLNGCWMAARGLSSDSHFNLIKMKNRFHILSVLLFLASASIATAVTVGEPAPDFTLKTPAGEEVSLSSLKGDYVVLEWVNPGCPFVKKFYNVGAMQAFQKEAQMMGAKWLSINSTNPDHKDYLDADASVAYYTEKGVNSTWLFDEDGTVGKAYDARTTPHCFVVDPEGNIIYAGAIDDKKSASSEDIADATNYVMTALVSAMAGEAVEDDRTRPYGCSVKY